MSPREALRVVWREEAAALERGDLDAAVEANLRAWVDGPHRAASDVDASMRAFVGQMQRAAFEKPVIRARHRRDARVDPNRLPHRLAATPAGKPAA